MLNERLKEERERLGLTQPDFAEVAGAKKRTLIDWEKGVSSPTAMQLASLFKIGVDVLYILTGIRQEQAACQEPLTKREAALLDNYRHIVDEGDKSAVERTALMAVRAIQGEKESGMKKKTGR